jgi:hypothetical protein
MGDDPMVAAVNRIVIIWLTFFVNISTSSVNFCITYLSFCRVDFGITKRVP